MTPFEKYEMFLQDEEKTLHYSSQMEKIYDQIDEASRWPVDDSLRTKEQEIFQKHLNRAVLFDRIKVIVEKS